MEPKEWYASIPPITRVLFTSMFALTLIGAWGIVSPFYLIYDLDRVIRGFQIWRLYTANLMFPKLSFQFLINMYFLYNYSSALEKGQFERRPADYAFCIFCLMFVLWIIGYVMSLMLLVIPFIISILYVWSSLNPTQTVRFWFGLTFPAMYLPWVLLAFNVLSGASNGMIELMGILTGHAYFFMKHKYPEMSGSGDILVTPGFVRRLLPDEAPGVSGFGAVPSTRAQPAPEPNFRAFGGRGHRLGD